MNIPRGDAKCESRYTEGVHIPILMGALVTATFLGFLDTSIIATAIPKITSEFHSLQDITWYGSAFQLASAAIQPLVGKIYTQFSLKTTYLIFFFIFEVGSLVCGAAHSSAMLIVGRAVSGIGAAGIITGGLSIIGTAIRPEIRAVLTGVVLGISSLGSIAGPLIGGAFTERVSWRWCFYINLPFAALVFVGMLFVPIAEPAPILPLRQVWSALHQKLDLVGFCLLSPAVIMLVLALQTGGTTSRWAWNSSTIVGLFCGFVIMLVLFVVWNWNTGKNALIPTTLCKSHIIIAAAFIQWTSLGIALLNSYWMPVYFQTVKGDSPIVSGVNLLPSILPSVFVGVLTGFLIGKIGFYLPFTIAGAVFNTIAAGLLSTLAPNTSVSHWAGYQVLLSISRGLVQQVSFVAITHATTPQLVPVAISMIMFSQYIGGALLLSLSNIIFSTTLQSELVKTVPGVNSTEVIVAGAYRVRQESIPPELLPGVLAAYCTSVSRVFYLALASGGIMLISGFFSGWVDTRIKEAGAGREDGSENRRSSKA